MALAVQSFASTWGFKEENKIAMYETHVWLMVKVLVS